MVGPFLTGFGLALLIQFYQQGLIFTPLWVAWALLIIGIVATSGIHSRFIK
jgi:hypothetical protein